MSRCTTVFLVFLAVVLGLLFGCAEVAEKTSSSEVEVAEKPQGLAIGARFSPFNVTDVNTGETLCYV